MLSWVCPRHVECIVADPPQSMRWTVPRAVPASSDSTRCKAHWLCHLVLSQHIPTDVLFSMPDSRDNLHLSRLHPIHAQRFTIRFKCMFRNVRRGKVTFVKNSFDRRVKLELQLGSYLSPSGSLWYWLQHVSDVTVAYRPIRDNAQLHILSQFCACCFSSVCIGCVLGTFSPERSNSSAHARSCTTLHDKVTLHSSGVCFEMFAMER